MHRSPRYVQVYNQILAMIKGKGAQFAPGSKLPSEETMANSFDVSRVTLRTALSLLKEDGVIRSVHGQGHFVSGDYDGDDQGIETMENPLLKSLTTGYETVETYHFINKPSSYTDELLGAENQLYLTVNLWYRSGNGNVANELTIMRPGLIAEQGGDLEDADWMQNFLERGIYQLAASSELTVTLSDRPVTTFKRPFKGSIPLMLMTEDLFTTDGTLLAQNKFYVPAKQFRAHLHRYANRN